MMFKRRFIEIWILSLLFSPFLWVKISASAEIPRANQAEGPISITSNKMMVKSQENKIIFEGNVVIKKGDLKIKADRAEVLLAQKESEKNPKGDSKFPSSLLIDPTSQGEKEVSRIETFGNVDLQQGEKHAKAQKGVYDQKRNEIVLTGAPEVWENDYYVKGKVITLFLAENRSLVEGSQVIINSKPEKLKPRGRP